ncbi:hypothetical protein EMIHUDRAFT_443019 [Emiliania huxleyi CCMP1516]|uniref:Thiaminase-2/PQQC domain-containing protein n=3 Tax=Emiliania huxleyi TaxID=2903 RepID=A0A0D3JXB8_EMIH1|nr:hypothetical protein EMIHUDRAFT_443019 [Emiliania huxleyi CCMP1516]EOD28153.1 hypothetical protein EMIHUDRAFT_443019 [Emiliania huxleyi CCMP1516]|eukprot:XP_005780582.1 hypothetical protein EMIHUDRAFT_443019 [Emiliania huxleyi CCMP1516]
MISATLLAFAPCALLPAPRVSPGAVRGRAVGASAVHSPLAAKALDHVSSHPVVEHNPYCDWFSKGEATEEQVKDLVVQFSVFSNLFLLAQLNKVINSPTLEGAREGKEILANEIGVVFKPQEKKTAELAREAAEKGFDPNVVSVTGSVEGGVFSHRAAHFEWLCDVGKDMGLTFDELGKRRHGSEATLHFCDALYRIYGSEDLSTALGASFAIEHWANAGFWDELIEGFEKLNGKRPSGAKKFRMGFWRFHQALEAQHAAHTMDELEEAITEGLITDELRFQQAAREMLDACAIFWEGLDASRQGRPYSVTTLKAR